MINLELGPQDVYYGAVPAYLYKDGWWILINHVWNGPYVTGEAAISARVTALGLSANI